jgi:protein TonB
MQCKALLSVVLGLAAVAGQASDAPGIPADDFGGAVPRPFTARIDDDIPKGVHGTVVIGFTIDVKGRMRDCEVIRSSGSARLDAFPCEVLPKHMRFRPARGGDGKPVATRGTKAVTF